MSPAAMPSLIAVDWWALGAVLALTAGILLLLLLEFVPRKPESSRGAGIPVLLVHGGIQYPPQLRRCQAGGGMARWPGGIDWRIVFPC